MATPAEPRETLERDLLLTLPRVPELHAALERLTAWPV